MESNCSNYYDFLKKNTYNKMKRKLNLFQIKAEYNIVYNFLINPIIVRAFIQKEMKNVFFQTSFSNKKNDNEINKYMTNLKNNGYNTFSIPNNEKKGQYFLFKVKSIFNENYYNHSIYILRFIKVENENNNNNLSKNNSDKIADIVISFYTDINDNSTILINELYTNLSDSLFIQFNQIVHLFYEKLAKFTKEKVTKFLCFESILIPKNMQKIFNYLYSCKIFHNKKFQIKKIQKDKEDMEISCQIGSLFPVNICETKLFIRSLSNNSCLVEIVNWMNTSDFTTQGKLLNIKSIISLFLKTLRCRINSEGKDTSKEININK